MRLTRCTLSFVHTAPVVPPHLFAVHSLLVVTTVDAVCWSLLRASTSACCSKWQGVLVMLPVSAMRQYPLRQVHTVLHPYCGNAPSWCMKDDPSCTVWQAVCLPSHHVFMCRRSLPCACLCQLVMVTSSILLLQYLSCGGRMFWRG